MLGGGWFCGGADDVRNDSGGVEVQPPEEHDCRQGWILTYIVVYIFLIDKIHNKPLFIPRYS